MTLPLYKDCNAPSERPIKANAGLWFERFFDQYGYEWKVGDEKTDWLKNNFNRSTGDTTQLENHAQRQWKLVNKLKGKAQVFTTQWHFITGMGNPHPVENGLSWHPVLGVPYLTGAAVKGIVRSWLEVWEPEENEEQQKEKLLEWFGSTSKNPNEKGYQAQAGNIIFFDAFPIEAVLMNVDIMTPHMGKWYEKGGKIKDYKKEPDSVPADWHEPKPIPFLAVKKAHFLFSFAPRNKRCNVDKSVIMTALESALNYMAAGAKTAVGYGQMLANESSTKDLNEAIKDQENEATMQSLSKEQQQLMVLSQMLEKDKETGNKAMGNPTFQRMMTLIKQAQADNWEQVDKNQLADIGDAIFSYLGWGKGKKKRERKEMLSKLMDT